VSGLPLVLVDPEGPLVENCRLPLYLKVSGSKSAGTDRASKQVTRNLFSL